MTVNYYGIYFNRHELKVDADGVLINPEVLKIIEFEYDEHLGDVIAIRQIAEDGSIIEIDPDLRNLEHYGYDDDDSVEEAFLRFEEWLEENIEWRQSSPQTYWQPVEYVCIGIKDNLLTSDDKKWRWWDEGGKEQTLYGL